MEPTVSLSDKSRAVWEIRKQGFKQGGLTMSISAEFKEGKNG